jgi:hypothetical protein
MNRFTNICETITKEFKRGYRPSIARLKIWVSLFFTFGVEGLTVRVCRIDQVVLGLHILLLSQWKKIQVLCYCVKTSMGRATRFFFFFNYLCRVVDRDNINWQFLGRHFERIRFAQRKKKEL